jgi:hypothetical protein
MARTLYSENVNLTEREFLLRELGLQITFLDPSVSESLKVTGNQKLVFIATTNPKIWRDFLEKRPSESVVFLLLGNETYHKETYLAFNDLVSIRLALIYALPQEGRVLNSLGGLLGQLIDSTSFSTPYLIQSLRDFKTGMIKLTQSKSISFAFPTIRLPQGYSNAFVLQLERFIADLEEHESLLENKKIANLVANSESLYSFGFVGQSGPPRRMHVIEHLKALQNSHVIVKQGFGGNDTNVDNSYLQMLIKTKLPVIPPGAFNTLNHRYTESLIMNRLPIIVANVPTDSFWNNNWSRSLGLFSKFSYKYLLKRCFRFSNQEIDLRVLQAKAQDFGEIKRTKDLLRTLVP